MSGKYMREFKTENACAACPKQTTAAAPGKSFCATHLRVAKLGWRVWSYVRHEKKRCIECNSRSKAGTGRCAKHRERNRAKCMEWSRDPKNAARVKKYTAQRKESYAARGLCYACSAHAPLVPGRARCLSCRRAKSGAKLDVVSARKEAMRARARDALTALSGGRDPRQLSRYSVWGEAAAMLARP